MTARLALRLDERLASKTLTAEVEATDTRDAGSSTRRRGPSGSRGSPGTRGAAHAAPLPAAVRPAAPPSGGFGVP